MPLYVFTHHGYEGLKNVKGGRTVEKEMTCAMVANINKTSNCVHFMRCDILLTQWRWGAFWEFGTHQHFCTDVKDNSPTDGFLRQITVGGPGPSTFLRSFLYGASQIGKSLPLLAENRSTNDKAASSSAIP